MNVNVNFRKVDLTRPELNYVKTILSKVSFDKKLFEKELNKALAKLNKKEQEDLKNWCYTHFENPYNMVLNKCFNLRKFNF